MKRKVTLSLLMTAVLASAFLTVTHSASSGPADQGISTDQRIAVPQAVSKSLNLMPLLTTTFDVDRTDDTAAASACTNAANDCSLRGAIIAANANVEC